MLVEVPLHLSALPETPSIDRMYGCLVEAYDGCRFVEVAGLDEIEAMAGLDPEGLNGTNRMRLHVFGDRDRCQARLVALLDNLGKGASGAAVQNLNLMLGLDEATGLV
jgi:N-acetyl-gamma-glutamyl-phosphate reductase